jgi:DNA-binding transcriptional regulator YiaG
MPNIASALRDEILRLARKEVRREVEGLRKASAQYRTEIAGLKRRLAALEKGSERAARKAGADAPQSEAEGAPRVRFSAKRLAALRQRLGLTAADFGALLGISAQSVYNWEAEKTRPRAQQLLAIASLRGMGKRRIRARLAELAEG